MRPKTPGRLAWRSRPRRSRRLWLPSYSDRGPRRYPCRSAGSRRRGRGEYTRRGPDAENRPIDKDIDEARDHYMKEAKAVVNDVVDSAKRAAQAFSDAFKKR